MTDQPQTQQRQLELDRESKLNLLLYLLIEPQNHYSLMRKYKYSLGINLATLEKFFNICFYLEVLHVRVYLVKIAP